jgi:demethylspheroidene O-methyltransferase
LVAHHALLYDDLRDPVALLRGARDRDTALSRYWAYAGEEERSQAIPADRVAEYSRLMAEMVPPLAAEILDAYDVAAHRCVLDVGGGEGGFLRALGERCPRPRLMLFDLPAVVARARDRLSGSGLDDRLAFHGGNFHTDSLPRSADLILLVRVLLDHDDPTALRLLRRVREALPTGGVLLIAEPFAGERGAEPVGDAYFGFYLLAMGRGRARRAGEYHAMLRAAGFARSHSVRTRYPVQTGLIVAHA